ncbi:hypothetical protein GOBAR_DD17330 [Gossypium barbadense]|nr:hypothetical protein GOBAR_DD17330 [Gossypium barbadense]
MKFGSAMEPLSTCSAMTRGTMVSFRTNSGASLLAFILQLEIAIKFFVVRFAQPLFILVEFNPLFNRPTFAAMGFSHSLAVSLDYTTYLSTRFLYFCFLHSISNQSVNMAQNPFNATAMGLKLMQIAASDASPENREDARV